MCCSRARWGSGVTTLVGLLLWGLAGGSPAAGLDHDQGSPVAAVDQATYDFGEVYEGEHLAHSFTVRNTGSAPLELHDPAAKVQNAGSDGNVFWAPAIRAEVNNRIVGLVERPSVFPIRFAAQAETRLSRPLLTAGGRPAAPS